QQIYESLDRLTARIQASTFHGEYRIAYLQLSLLQISFLQDTYEICVAAYDRNWYRERGIYDSISVAYLFEELTEIKTQCMNSIKKYVGKVRASVVEQCILDEIATYNQFFQYYLMQWFLQIEEVDCFQKLPKEENVLITWGNYKAEAQIIHNYDVSESNLEQFQSLLNKKDEAKLMYTTWQGLQLQDIQIAYKNMTGISFKEAVLKNVTFEQSYLVGSNFKGSELSDCLFGYCDLKICDFTGCRLSNVTFTACDMRECVWEGAEFIDVKVIDGECVRVVQNEKDLYWCGKEGEE
ncbi:MAG TPA: pentapeptide repeat-containing protein, partial [Lachnospiraceae bacterium]|nr:pentapeptide repeat-containing protein [Lachnospiraceae bacterium]